MAIPYESAGQQVPLTGSQTAPSFAPRQVAVTPFDPSRQMLQQSEQDLTAFSQFSDTLTSFLTDRAKEKNKSEYDLGVADIINGDRTLNPQAYQNYKSNVRVLENAALVDEEVAKSMEPTNVGAAESFRQESKAASGWRAYGQAVTLAQQSAGQAETTIGAFLKDTTTKIPIVQADGSVREITPATAKTKSELMAVWAFGLQQFMGETGITRVNPAIIAEHLTPVMVRAKGKLLGERMDEIALNNKKEKLDLLSANTGKILPGFKNPLQAQTLITSTFKGAYELTGNWKDANDLGNQLILKKIEALGYSDPEQAKTFLTNYENSLIDPEKPELLGVRDRFGEDIGALRSKLNGTIKEQSREAEESANEEIDGLVNAYQANPSPALFSDVEKELESRQLLYPRATLALDKLRELGKNYNPKNDEALLTAIEKKIITSYADVLALKAINAISPKAADAAKDLLPSTDMEKMLPPRTTMVSFGRDYLRNLMKAQGIPDGAFTDKTAATLNAVVDAASAATMRQLQSKDMDRFKAQTFMEEQIKAALGPNGDFTPRKDKDQNWIIPTPGSIRGLMPVRPRAAGPTGFDMAYQALDKLPKIASARRDIMIKRDRLELNLDVMQNGGKPSADFTVLVKASGLSTPQFIQKQLKFYPDLKYNPAADAGTQTYQENLKYDRVAAEGLRLQRAKQQQTVQDQYQPGADVPAGKGSRQQALKQAAEQLGIRPVDLAAVMSLETGGSFNPDIGGGAGGAYRGLIQFGPSEQKTYGWNKGMGFEQQVLGPVVRYLKARGVKPGHGVQELYSAILTGNTANIQQGGLDWKDSFGTSVRGALPSLTKGGHYRNAVKFLTSN